ncbi:MAG TPA: HD domain-containing phosphohydrolase, partial [Burkholderiaceae bacterium]|nr:HD domain-containing phosphohydrolase [Burkholderiaceae bacterium]
LSARIAALADVFDALTHARSYKRAWSVSDALNEIIRLNGLQFDPQLTQEFVLLVHRLRRDHGDLDEFLGQAARTSKMLQARRQIADLLNKPHASPSVGTTPS